MWGQTYLNKLKRPTLYILDHGKQPSRYSFVANCHFLETYIVFMTFSLTKYIVLLTFTI